MDSSHTGKPVGHIPLLWLALPVLGGVVVAEGISGPGDSLIPLLLISGLLGSLLALVASIGQSRLTSLTWKLCFPVAAFLLAWAYAQWRSGPASAPGPDIAAREVVIQVRIERRPRLLPSGNAFTTTARAVEPPA